MNIFKKLDVWSLVVANLVTIFLALFNRVNIFDVVFIYWCQNIIIGFFYFLKLYQIPLEVYYQAARQNYKTMPPIEKLEPEAKLARVVLALFFGAHYGTAHFYFLIMIIGFGNVYLARAGQSVVVSSTNFGQILGALLALFVPILMFGLNHYFSYKRNKDKEIMYLKINLKSLVYRPYFRVIPMSFIVLMAINFEGLALIAFLLLKTIADVALHLWEHKEPNPIRVAS